jgi:hypothetical protein
MKNYQEGWVMSSDDSISCSKYTETTFNSITLIDDTSRAQQIVDMISYMLITNYPESVLTDAENGILTRDLVQTLFTGI